MAQIERHWAQLVAGSSVNPIHQRKVDRRQALVIEEFCLLLKLDYKDDRGDELDSHRQRGLLSEPDEAFRKNRFPHSAEQR